MSPGTYPCILVLPTRKVQGLGAYKHLRVLTGTPHPTIVMQTSLVLDINDILRDSNSGFIEHSTSISAHPELTIITIIMVSSVCVNIMTSRVYIL